MSGKGTPFGAFLDSTLDRIEEGFVLTAVAVYFAGARMQLAVAACVIAVLASLVVSYTRARAEALGVECKVGIAEPSRAIRRWSSLRKARDCRLRALAPAVYVLAGLSIHRPAEDLPCSQALSGAPRRVTGCAKWGE